MTEILSALKEQLDLLDQKITVRARDNPPVRRLGAPGLGPILSSEIVAITIDPTQFDSGRDFAASLGLVPRRALGSKETRHSSWGHETPGP